MAANELVIIPHLRRCAVCRPWPDGRTVLLASVWAGVPTPSGQPPRLTGGEREEEEEAAQGDRAEQGQEGPEGALRLGGGAEGAGAEGGKGQEEVIRLEEAGAPLPGLASKLVCQSRLIAPWCLK